MRESVYVHAESSNPAKTMLTTNTQRNGCQAQLWKIHAWQPFLIQLQYILFYSLHNANASLPFWPLPLPGTVYAAENFSSPYEYKNPVSFVEWGDYKLTAAAERERDPDYLIWWPTNESLSPQHHQYLFPQVSPKLIPVFVLTNYTPGHSIDSSLGKEFSYKGTKGISKSGKCKNSIQQSNKGLDPNPPWLPSENGAVAGDEKFFCTYHRAVCTTIQTAQVNLF